MIKIYQSTHFQYHKLSNCLHLNRPAIIVLGQKPNIFFEMTSTPIPSGALPPAIMSTTRIKLNKQDETGSGRYQMKIREGLSFLPPGF